MNRHRAVVLVLVGLIIGLGISVSFDLNPVSSSAETDVKAEKLRKELDTIQRGSQAFFEAIPKVAELVKPTVVSIHTQKKMPQRPQVRPPQRRRDGRSPFNNPFRRFFDDDFDFWHPWNGGGGPGVPRRSLGSGVIVDSRGHILTNSHVVSGFEASEITITTGDGVRHKVEKVVGTDPKSDLAVLKITPPKVAPAELGDSRKMRVGDWVVAIGSPFGYSHSVSAGIISATGRRNVLPPGPRPKFSYQNFIQTDAVINPGNSGGPLVNLKGEIIGINTAIASRSGGYQGIGFAIPTQIAKKVLDDLVREGKVTRGYLGVEIANLSEDLAKEYNFDSLEEMAKKFKLTDVLGVFVRRVFDRAPADRAGVEPSDVIVEIDGEKMTNSAELADYVAGIPVGKKVQIIVVRGGKRRELTVEIAEQPDQVHVSARGGTKSPLGLTVQALTPELARRLGYEGHAGVVVSEVVPGSRAQRAGIEEGDLITKVIVDGEFRAVATPEEFRKAVQEADKEGKGVAMQVRDKEGQQFVPVN